jgi:hypothetical protein
MSGSIPSAQFAARSDHGAITAALLSLALIAGLATTSAPAMTPLPSTPEQPVHMLCVDAGGNPVANAELHLYQCVSEKALHYDHFGPFTSDAQGKAVCPKAVFSNEHGNFDRWIYARVPGRLVGVARGAKWTNRAAFNPEGRVKLFPSRSIEGQVTVPAGFDLSKVTIRARYLTISSGPGALDYATFARHDQFPGLDTALPEIFECRPDSAGRVRFSDIPVHGQLTLVSSGAGLAEAQWRNDGNSFDKPIELALEKESFVSGRVLLPDGKPAIGMKVSTRLAPREHGKTFFLSSFHAASSSNGEFAIHSLPQIDFVLLLEDPKKRWVFRPLQGLLVEPGNDPRLVLSMEAGTLVSGRIIDQQGKPVQAASLAAVADAHRGPGLAADTSDENGHYQFRLPSGNAHLYFSGLPDGFAYPKPQVVKELEIKPGRADIQHLDFTLERQSTEHR